MTCAKPKFEQGQVVAIFGSKTQVPKFYRIAGFFYDNLDELRYRFDVAPGDSGAEALCPVEKLLRPLTVKEARR